MSRKLSKKALRFARIWGEIKSFDDQEWLHLLDLHNDLIRAGAEERSANPRKPRGGTPEEPKS